MTWKQDRQGRIFKDLVKVFPILPFGWAEYMTTRDAFGTLLLSSDRKLPKLLNWILPPSGLFTRRRVVWYRRFETTHLPHLQASSCTGSHIGSLIHESAELRYEDLTYLCLASSFFLSFFCSSTVIKHRGKFALAVSQLLKQRARNWETQVCTSLTASDSFSHACFIYPITVRCAEKCFHIRHVSVLLQLLQVIFPLLYKHICT